jgi:hypothetical protein
MRSGKLRGGEAWEADVSCVVFHIPGQLQREKGGDMEGSGCHVTAHLSERQWLRAEKST